MLNFSKLRLEADRASFVRPASRYIILGVALTLAACGGTKRIENAAVPLAEMAELPPPSAPSPDGPRYSYILPGDELSVEVFGIEELSRDVIVDADGSIDYPLIGLVDTTGKTRNELADDIATQLRAGYVREPHVSINLKSLDNRTYSITGAVKKAGNYPVVYDMTLLRALSEAGGLTENAKPSDVVVFRTVNNERIAALYDLREIQVGNYQDIAIYPADTIVVGSSSTSVFLRTLATAVPFIYVIDRVLR